MIVCNINEGAKENKASSETERESLSWEVCTKAMIKWGDYSHPGKDEGSGKCSLIASLLLILQRNHVNLLKWMKTKTEIVAKKSRLKNWGLIEKPER